MHLDVKSQLPVRYGVAPDHPEVKNVINTFTKTAQNPNFNFYGNISLGKDIKLSELRNLYDVVILCYGADVDSHLGIPGEDSKNVIAARDFVGWYNGSPYHDKLNPDLSGNAAVIVGQGNVAIDVARILLSPIDKLRATDITEYALEKLSRSSIKEVFMVGRRGPCQAAFTIAELREMLKMTNVATEWRAEDFSGIPQLIETLQRPRKRLTELMVKSLEQQLKSEENRRKFLPIFYRSPLKINSSDGAVNSIDFSVTDLVDNKAVPTDKVESIEAQLVCRSIGYKSICVDDSVNFDAKLGRVRNDNGRALKVNSNELDYGLYVGGWLASGPSGVILTTMNNAFSVAQTIIDDVKEGKIKCGDKAGLNPKNYQNVTTWDDWLKIDKVEIEEGKKMNKCREKISSVDKMLNIVF